MWKKFLKKIQEGESYASMALGLLVVILIAVALVNIFQKKSPKTSSEAVSEEAATQEPTILPATHTVVEGETLWSIAEKYFHSGYNWVDLAKENKLVNPDLIYIGQNLTIPNASPILPLTGQEPGETPEKYTVQKGDSLWNISCNLYNDCYRWGDIAIANNISDPNLIETGTVFTIPR